MNAPPNRSLTRFAPPRLVVVRNEKETIVLESESPHLLPPLDLPQPTEPASTGHNWRTPSPKREPLFDKNPYASRAIAWALVSAGFLLIWLLSNGH